MAEKKGGAALVPRHRELTKKQAEAHVKKAFTLERKIKASFGAVSQSWWVLGEQLYEFHEGGYWSALGYDSLDEFLAQPDLGISRTQFFRMTKMWRDLIVVKQVPVEDLKEIEPSKVREIVPAIMSGDVAVDDALDDARELGYRDIQKKYRPDQQATHGQKTDDSKPLAAEDEPELVQCEHCGSWYTPDEVDE